MMGPSFVQAPLKQMGSALAQAEFICSVVCAGNAPIGCCLRSLFGDSFQQKKAFVKETVYLKSNILLLLNIASHKGCGGEVG